jgi:cytochrome P450
MQEKDLLFATHWIPDAFRALNQHESSVIWLPVTSPNWKQLRSTWVMHLLSPRRLDSTRLVRDKKIRDILRYIRQQTGRPLDIGQVLFAGFLNMVSTLSFSEDVMDLDAESPQKFKEIIEAINIEFTKSNISDFFPFLRLLDLQGTRRHAANHIGHLFHFIDGVIDRRLNKSDEAGKEDVDFLDALLQLFLESKLDRKQIRNILMEVFLAGADTNSTTLLWALAELIRNPNSMEKVRNELRDVIGSQELDELNVSKLPYLQAVVKESIRMHPVAPFIVPRVIMEDGVEIGGFDMPKDARVIINAWAIGHDPTVWPEPHVFSPERFLETGENVRKTKVELISFGLGRRGCPGMPLALRVVPFVLALMIHEFEWSLPDGMKPEDLDLTENNGNVLAPCVPLRVVPTPAVNH